MWHVWERRGAYGVLVGKPEGNRPLVIPRHIYARIILKWIIYGSGWGKVVGCIEHGNELPGSIKCEEHLDQLRNWYRFTKDCALGS
jgi:hypothetical protein